MKRLVCFALAATLAPIPVPASAQLQHEASIEVVWSYQVFPRVIPEGMTVPAPVSTSVGVLAAYPYIKAISLIDPGTGEAFWTVDLGEFPSAISWSSSLALILLEDGRLVALDLLSGDEVFSEHLDLRGDRYFLVYSGGVVLAASGRRAVALDLTGSVLWEKSFEGPVVGVDRGDDSFLVFYEGGLVKLGPVSGQERWSAELDEVSSWGICGGRVFAVTKSGDVSCFDVESGEVVGRFRILELPSPGRMPCFDGLLFAAAQRRVFLIDSEGVRAVLPAVHLDDVPCSQPLVVNGLGIILGFSGLIQGFSRDPNWGVVIQGELGGFPASELSSSGDYLLAYTRSGRLVVLRVPHIFVSRVSASETPSGELRVEALVCSLLTSRPGISVFLRDDSGQKLSEVNLSPMEPGDCDTASLSTSLEGVSGVSLVVRADNWMYGPVSLWVQPPRVEPEVAVGLPEGSVVGEASSIQVAISSGSQGGRVLITLESEELESRPVEFYISEWESVAEELRFKPLAPGDVPAVLRVSMDGEVIYEESFTISVTSGHVVEGFTPPPSSGLVETSSYSVEVQIVNRYLDGATFTLEVSGALTGRSVVGPLGAGESARVSIPVRAVSSGEALLRVSSGEFSEEVSLGSFEVSPAGAPAVSVSPQPAPSERPGLPGLPTDILEVAAGVGLVLGVALIVSKIRGRPREVEVEIPPELPPRPAVRPSGPRRPAPTARVEVERKTLRELEERLSAAREKIESIKAEVSSLGEVPGLPERISDVERMADGVEAAITLEDVDEARGGMVRLEEAIEALETYLRQYKNVFLGPGWAQVERRIATMLNLWGRAPASMLTMVPQELRVSALARYMKEHPELSLELRGDELHLKGEQS